MVIFSFVILGSSKEETIVEDFLPFLLSPWILLALFNFILMFPLPFTCLRDVETLMTLFVFITNSLIYMLG